MSKIGVEPLILEFIWEKYGKCEELSLREDLLLLFNFMKEYPTQDVLASNWKISRPTLIKKIWTILYYLNDHMNEISLDDRFNAKIGIFEWGAVVGIHDATECPIERPVDNNLRRLFYSGKKKDFTLKYEITVCISDGIIFWERGGLPGKVHDLRLFRHYGLADQLEPWEFLMADSGYQGEETMIIPFKRDLDEEKEDVNFQIGGIRVLVERVFRQIKVFRCLQVPWRHYIYLHPIVFNIACQVTNIKHRYFPIII